MQKERCSPGISFQRYLGPALALSHKRLAHDLRSHDITLGAVTKNIFDEL